MVIDFFMLLLAGIVGGMIGGSIAYIFSRKAEKSRFSETTQLKPTELRVTSARNKKAVVIEFPPKEIKFSKN